MKSIKLTGIEIHLLQESLKLYKEALAKQEFAPNSIVTREYLEMHIKEIEEKLAKK